MRQILILFLFLLIFNLSGCTKTEFNSDNIYLGESINSISESVETEKNVINIQKETDIRERLDANFNEETMSEDAKGIHIQSTFTTRGNKMYFFQWPREGRKASLYVTEIGKSELQEIHLSIPDDMAIFCVSTDNFGNIYLLVRTKLTIEKEKVSYIWKLDLDGNIEQELDVSKVMQDKIAFFDTFLVTREGNFYFQGGGLCIYINNDGTKEWETTNEIDGISCSYISAMGDDGSIYKVYQKNGSTYIGQINEKNGLILDEYLFADIKEENHIIAMAQGVDSDFLLYGLYSGIWAWNKSTNQYERRIDSFEGSEGMDECIVVRGFLEDGRLIIIKNVAKGGELSERIYNYIPTNK